MSGECRPPPGTPDKTWCILRRVRVKHDRWLYAKWTRYGNVWLWTWRTDGSATDSKILHLLGWRFHSIATPEPKP